MTDLLTSRALAAQPHVVLVASVADGAAEIERLELRIERLQELLAEAEESPYDEIRFERARQDIKWGGPEHDDTHGWHDWIRFIDDQANKWPAHPNVGKERRSRLIKIAALAVAAIESHDRRRAVRAALEATK